MVTGRTALQLEHIDDVVTISKSVDAQVWLRGGWAMDFFLGRVTRAHEDIDWFAWAADAPVLVEALSDHGYRRIPGPPPEQQIDVAKGGEELSFAWLTIDDVGRVVCAGGRWAGEPWPDRLLEWPPGRIGEVQCPIISPSAQIEIKEMMPIWVPGRPRRQKDQADVRLLRQALAEDQRGR